MEEYGVGGGGRFVESDGKEEEEDGVETEEDRFEGEGGFIEDVFCTFFFLFNVLLCFLFFLIPSRYERVSVKSSLNFS